MMANLDNVAVGEPVTFTVGKTNVLPTGHDWSVRDHLPAGMKFVSATSSQGSCTLLEDSGVVQCELGNIPSGGSATMDITVTPTEVGEMTNYAADNAENEASTTVVVGRPFPRLAGTGGSTQAARGAGGLDGVSFTGRGPAEGLRPFVAGEVRALPL